MKKLINATLVIIIAVLCPACGTKPIPNDKDIVLLVDQSDPLKVTPDADEISTELGLKEEIWQGITVTVTYVSDKDVNASKVITLEKADRLSGNIRLRTAQVMHFKKQLRSALSGTYNTCSLDHSIIYRTVAKQVNALGASTATNRILLVYSDLMENSDLSFYSPVTLTLLRTHPDIIRQQLAKSVVLHNLTGVQVWLLYDPPSYRANGIYISIANIYKQLLESKGAAVHIDKTLNL